MGCKRPASMIYCIRTIFTGRAVTGMGERKWTDQQKQCLDAGGTVLVSAAAGSGKTAVLVERVIRLITDPAAPVEVDRLLVVTFTKAAAAEMKQRIAGALNALIAARPGDRRLRSQLMKLPQASISTVHSFCSGLIRENFHRLPEVSPCFKVGESQQTGALFAAALDEVIGEAYEEADPAFEKLKGALSDASGDESLAQRLTQLYSFVQADPDPDRWLTRRAEMYRQDLPPEETPWGREILEGVKGTLDWCARLCRQGIRMAMKDGTVADLAGTFQKDLELIAELQHTVDTADWDDICFRLQALEAPGAFAKAAPIKKETCTDPALKEKVTALRDRIKEKLRGLWKQMLGSRERIREDTAELAPCMDKLCDLVRKLTLRYGEKKSRADLLDYNDLEHYALQLLVEDRDGTPVPTPLAEEVAARFDWVMVDEYQDTNPTQEALFRAVSREEKNLFFVGDVKQSVYGFRNATPGLFIARRDRYPDFDGETYPALIRLGHNFRSRRGVIDTANFLCGQLMTLSSCGVDYTGGEELVYAADYSEKEELAELILVDKEEGDAGAAADTLEATALIRRLLEMKATFTVKEGAGERPMRWGDVCVLMRSATGHAARFADLLRRAGIPALCDAGSGFYTAPEVQLAVSFLRFLDNPLDEVSLLAVLMSPLFAFTPDDMAAVSGHRKRERSLFALLRRCARGETGPAAKCRAFLQVTDRLRDRATALPADRLLGILYQELGLIPVMAARTHGEQRVANLQKLWDAARSFERSGYRGLSAFVRYLDRETEGAGRDQSAPVERGEDAVRIMSVHGSKGLEFPVVFLAGLGHSFNTKSATNTLLLHRELGMGMKYYDDGTMVKDNTLQRAALARRIRRDELAEELRILYVAVTRARERLCFLITGSVEKLLQKAASAGDGPLPTEAILEAGSMGEWVLMALLRHPDADDLRRIAGGEEIQPLPCGSGLKISFPGDLTEVTEQPELPAIPPADEGYLAALKERVEYVYPYRYLETVPAKLAASDLADRRRGESFVASARPAFFSESDLTPAERGTAVHQFMQFARYPAAAADLEGEIRRLVRAGFLSEQQGKSLPRDRIRGFFGGELYRRIAASPRVLREYAFTVERPAALYLPELPPAGPEEQTVIQGIADCVFREGDRYVIVDYKTDRVETPQELADRYRPQLEVYRQALEEMLDAPVGECLLYSFHLRRTVPLD